MDITDKELHVLRHTLGLDRMKESYRNYFATSIGTSDYPICEGLVVKGMMTKRKDPFNEMETSFVYHATDDGKLRAIDPAPADQAGKGEGC